RARRRPNVHAEESLDVFARLYRDGRRGADRLDRADWLVLGTVQGGVPGRSGARSPDVSDLACHRHDAPGNGPKRCGQRHHRSIVTVAAARALRAGGPLLESWLLHHLELDTAVFGAIGLGVIRHGRVRFAVSGRFDARGLDAFRHQIVDDRLRSALGKPLIVAPATDVVGVAVDLELHRRAAFGDIGAAVEQRLALAVELGTVGLEIDRARFRDYVEADFAGFRRDRPGLLFGAFLVALRLHRLERRLELARCEGQIEGDRRRRHDIDAAHGI